MSDLVASRHVGRVSRVARLAIFAVGLVCLAALSWLHVHIAVVVVAGAFVGCLLTAARRPWTGIALVAGPFAAVAWLTYALTWRYPLFGAIRPLSGPAALAPLQWTLAAGVLVACVLPYVAARLERRRLGPSVAALVATLWLLASFGTYYVSSGLSPIDPVPIQRNLRRCIC
jgi:hypothetical protein